MLVKHSRESIKRTVYAESDDNNMAIKKKKKDILHESDAVEHHSF